MMIVWKVICLALSVAADLEGSYAPINVTCPSSALVRAGNGLSSSESTYVAERREQIAIPAFQSWLQRNNISYPSQIFSNTSSAPNFALAFSGGGYRAMLNAAGIYNGLDARSNSTSLGGILQSSTYMAGLSGGNWFVGSAALHNFATVQNLTDSVWHLEDSLADGGSVIGSISYYHNIVNTAQQKEDAGFEITITDFWGLALSQQLVNPATGGLNITFSSIANMTSFKSRDMPFPIVIADGRRPDETIISQNTTVYEFSPYEFGTWDADVRAFTPTQYIGSNLTNGKPLIDNTCVNGYDNAGFVMGTSSSLFNSALLQLGSNSTSILQSALRSFLSQFAESDEDVAFYPNPFEGINATTNPAASYSNLSLVDGGEDLQNIPLWPLLQPERQVDAIIAVDSSADTVPYNWPNGTSLVATYERIQLNKSIAIPFPSIPDQTTIVNLGLNTRPTFFGCNASNYTTPPPIVIYMPHTAGNAFTNFSTFKLSYAPNEVASFIDNGIYQITQGNDTSHWMQCLACALMQRSKERSGLGLDTTCQSCFNQYCWNGTVSTTSTGIAAPGGGNFQPTLQSNGSTYSQTQGKSSTNSTSSTTSGSARLNPMYILFYTVVASFISSIIV